MPNQPINQIPTNPTRIYLLLFCSSTLMENPNGGNPNNQENQQDFENQNPDLHPSWSLFDYCVTVGRDLRALETKRLQLQEQITELKAVASAAPHCSPIQVNALKTCIDLCAILTTTLIELGQKEQASGLRLSNMMMENHFAITNLAMVGSLRELYDLGWRGKVIVPNNLNDNVKGELLEALQLMPEVVPLVVPLPVHPENILNQ